MVCDSRSNEISVDAAAGGADAGAAGSASARGTSSVNSADADDEPTAATRAERRRPQEQQQERPSWKMMRRDSDELNSYLAGDLAVGVRSREVDDDDSRSVESSSTTTSGGMLVQQQQQQPSSGLLPADENTTGSGNGSFVPSSLPFTSIRQPASGLSLTTHSSLSTSATADHNGGGGSIHSVTRQMSQTSEGGEGARTNAGGASASSVTPNNSVVSPRSPHAAHTPVAGNNNNNNNNVENTPPPTRAQAEGSGSTSDQPAPATTPSTRMVRSSSGVTADSWGFFDDHDPTIDTPGDSRRKTSGGGQAAATPGGSSSSNSNNHQVRGSSSTSTPGGGGSGSGPKRRGMLSDVMSQPLQEIPLLDPPKAELNPDAVTAPTYVLEESMSSQNLWKHTAGNRPPQPAEERAFYEKIWAENFSKSQVHYEMPPEVLMSTTPISLSAFADGRDDGAGVAADYAVLGHESGAGVGGGGGGGGAMAGKTIGGIGGSSSIGPSRMLGAAGAAQHYHLAKTGDSSLGPHHPHHTMVNRTVHEKDGDLLIVCKGDNVFGTTVSKSFETVVGSGSKRRTESVSVSVSVASYRVVECQKEKGKQYAQFLVIYCEGSFRDTVGVWRRYSDFKELSRKVMNGHGEGCATALQSMHPMAVTEEAETELMPNAITSWRLLKKRQRWFRCLDAGYLSLKVFLLERFLHDILFESSSPDILRNFVGAERNT